MMNSKPIQNAPANMQTNTKHHNKKLDHLNENTFVKNSKRIPNALSKQLKFVFSNLQKKPFSTTKMKMRIPYRT